VVLDLSPGLVRTGMTEGMWPDLDDDAYEGTRPIVEAVLAVAKGELDPLHGRFVHAVKDDVAELASRAQEIARTDARTLRLRTYGPNDPMADA
jgi:3-oxoacyl-[acyl-carrier protein] reductase